MHDEQTLEPENNDAEHSAAQDAFLKYQAEMFARIDHAPRDWQDSGRASDDLDARIWAR
jgi:hypothetical protein